MGITSSTPNVLYDKALLEQGKTLSAQIKGKFPNVQENILKKSPSYTPIFSISALTPAQASSQQYTSAKDFIVLGEAGFVGANDPRGRGNRVATAYGIPEYYLNNFEMTSFGTVSQGSGPQTAAIFKFEVFEPYSMGLFLQSLQNAALKAGWAQYLDCVFLLRIDFVGWTTGAGGTTLQRFVSDTTYSSGLLTQRLFPFKLSFAKFKTNESGTTYQVEAFPSGLTASTDNAKAMVSSASIAGKTVGEVLKTGEKSLEKWFKTQQAEVKAQGQEAQPDEYLIEFSDGRGEGKDIPTSGFPKGNRDTNTFTTVQIRNQTIQNDPFTTTPLSFNFPYREKNPHDIIKVIEEVMLNSDYCINNLNKPDPDGFIQWFKVNLETRYGALDPVRNTHKKTFVYWVTEYRVNKDFFQPANASPPSTSELCKKIVKKYDFYYTGQNDDVLKWDLDFNMAFFKAVLTKPAEATIASDQTKASATEAVEVYRSVPGENFDQLFRVTGAARVMRSKEAYKSPGSGAATDIEAVKIARHFQEAWKDSTDQNMIKLEMEILGDPYWLAYSGVRNQNSVPTDKGAMINADGTMAVDSSEILTFVGFRTPIDAPANGSLFEFPNSSYSPFSGVYRIVKVVNTIKDGIFTQKLTGFRLMTQAALTDPVINSLTSDQNLSMYKDVGDARPKSDEVDKSGAAKASVELGPPIVPGQLLPSPALANNLSQAPSPNVVTSPVVKTTVQGTPIP